jgi:T4-like virus tail tube protein gp19
MWWRIAPLRNRGRPGGRFAPPGRLRGHSAPAPGFWLRSAGGTLHAVTIAIKRMAEVVEHREGGDNSSSRKSQGRLKDGSITLERGVIDDPYFETSANRVWN